MSICFIITIEPNSDIGSCNRLYFVCFFFDSRGEVEERDGWLVENCTKEEKIKTATNQLKRERKKKKLVQLQSVSRLLLLFHPIVLS